MLLQKVRQKLSISKIIKYLFNNFLVSVDKIESIFAYY